jgi:hypothetical protein
VLATYIHTYIHIVRLRIAERDVALWTYLLGSRRCGLGLLCQSLVQQTHRLQLQRNVSTFKVGILKGRLQRLATINHGLEGRKGGLQT